MCSNNRPSSYPGGEETQLIDGDLDRISKLPECVISHIMSKLPITDAMKTCILSKDWEYKWTSSYNININDCWNKNKYDSCRTMERKKYVHVQLMERILRLSLSHHVRSFDLCYKSYEYDFTRIKAWILPVLGPNLESFALGLGYKGFVIPQNLLGSCTSLRCLSLSTCTFRVPDMYSFSNLTSLNFHRLKIVNNNSESNTIIFKFQVLQDFNVSGCKWCNVKFIEISAPSLKNFFWSSYHRNRRNNGKVVSEYTISTIGARLDLFEIRGNLSDRFILTRTTVSCAEICCRCDIQANELRAQSLFNEIPNVPCLKLEFDNVMGFAESKLVLPRYNNLARLVLYSCYDDSGLDFLLELLGAGPHLKFLEIEIMAHRDWNEDYYSSVENIPSCLTTSLEEVHFSYSFYLDDEKPTFMLEGFILKFAAQLKMVRFTVEKCPFDEDIIFKGLSALPAASPCFSIELNPVSLSFRR